MAGKRTFSLHPEGARSCIVHYIVPVEAKPDDLTFRWLICIREVVSQRNQLMERLRLQPDQSQLHRDAGESSRGFPVKQREQAPQGEASKSPELDLPGQAEAEAPADGGRESNRVQPDISSVDQGEPPKPKPTKPRPRLPFAGGSVCILYSGDLFTPKNESRK